MSNSKMTRSQGGREHTIFAFKTFAAELLISIIHLLISIKMGNTTIRSKYIFIDINYNSFIDINKMAPHPYLLIWPISRIVFIALSRGALVVYYDRRHLY